MAKGEIKYCQLCGKEFLYKGGRRCFCSDECAKVAKSYNAALMKPLPGMPPHRVIQDPEHYKERQMADTIAKFGRLDLEDYQINKKI